jgi:hypothetical protein
MIRPTRATLHHTFTTRLLGGLDLDSLGTLLSLTDLEGHVLALLERPEAILGRRLSYVCVCVNQARVLEVCVRVVYAVCCADMDAPG